MKIKAALAEAIEKKDAAKVGRVASYLRFNFGMNYAQTYHYANVAHPITEAEWDGLLYEADELENAS